MTTGRGLLWIPCILDRVMVRRLMGAVGYPAFGVPRLRTLAFTVGFGCQAVLAWQLLLRS